MSDIPTRRRWSAARLILVGFGVALAAGVLVGWMEADQPADAPLPIWLWLVLAAGFAAMAFLVLEGWRRMDEAAREAHKWAWYWGGSVGLGIASGLLALGPAADDLPWATWAVFDGDVGLVGLGVLACMLLQLAGYGVAWAYWWLSRR